MAQLQNIDSLLLNQKKISQEQYDNILKYKAQNKSNSIDAIIGLKIMDYNQIHSFIASLMGVKYISIRDKYNDLNPEIVALISEDMAKMYSIIPWSLPTSDSMELLMSNPRDAVARAEVENWTGKKVIPVFTNGQQLNDVLNYYYDEQRSKAEIERLANLSGSVDINNLPDDGSNGDDTPIVRLINMLFEKAAVYKASDIHIKPNEKNIRVRMRIDGDLREIATVDISAISAIISRIKVISNLNIAEKRKPQDGACQYITDKYHLEFRVSILPSLYGESCVMRVIDKSNKEYDFNSLGMDSNDEKIFKKMINRKEGLVLVTGPTGSGKTTTLYTALRYLNKESVNIITVEDPVESPINNINQVQVNPAAGLDFGAALRSILRHDPDIILIGEIRDEETAAIAVRSSITGHLVLSTLHTNDAISSIMRLNDMGIEKYMVTSALSGAIAQRLLKRVCPNCAEDHILSAEEAKIVGLPEGTVTKIGKGCLACGNSGYSGRIAIYELVRMTRELRELIMAGANTEEVRDLAIKQGMITLQDSCREVIRNGITSYKEGIKVIFAND